MPCISSFFQTLKNESSIYEEFHLPISLEAKEWSTGKTTASPRRSCFTGAGSFKMQGIHRSQNVSFYLSQGQKPL